MAMPSQAPAPADTVPVVPGLLAAPLHLFGVGALLAVTVLLSKLAAGQGASMLWFLAVVFLGAGGLLLAAAVAAGQMRGAAACLPYAAGAGLFAVLPTGMGYLAVGHVGAGFVSMTFAFPVLLTYLFALPIGLERAAPLKLAAVGLALAGGLILAQGKAALGVADPFWIGLASAVPVGLALGNLYRTRFWPPGAEPLPLAALSLLAGGVAAVPAALAIEGAPRLVGVWPLALAGLATLAVQYAFMFRLQRLAGPVYMSQIGSVAAVLGAFLAVVLLREELPSGFWPAATLIGAGAAAMQIARFRAQGVAAPDSDGAAPSG